METDADVCNRILNGQVPSEHFSHQACILSSRIRHPLVNPSRPFQYLHFRVHPYSPSLHRASPTSLRNFRSGDGDPLFHYRFVSCSILPNSQIKRPSFQELPRENELIRRRRRANGVITSVRLREMRPRRVFTGDSCSRVPETFIKSHQTLRRKPWPDRHVNHNRGGAVRTNPR
jgi:hypothetical protein